jgi:hypothetical protein
VTTTSPEGVYYTYYARIGSTDLPVYNIRASMDRDRITYCLATIECGWIDDATFAALDPRLGKRVVWNVEQFDVSTGTRVGYLPNRATSGTPVKANMWVRDVVRDPLNGTTVIELAGGESMLVDKIFLEVDPIDTESSTVQELVWWSLDDVFSSYSITFDSIVAATDIPVGGRTHLQPGQDHMQLVQSELDAINCRLLDEWGIEWYAESRADIDATIDLATATGVTGADPIVYEYTEHISRNGEWYDGVLIHFDMRDSDGGEIWQRSSTGGIEGANTRGLWITRKQNAPEDNGAEWMQDRTRQRGYDLNITARARFDFGAQWAIDINLPGPQVRSGNIRSIQWNTADSTMVIRAQSGVTL